MSKKFRLKPAEVLLIILCLLTLGLSTYLYVENFSLRSYFFPELGTTQQEQVAKLKSLSGELKRQSRSELVFQNISNNEVVYNYDTLVTSTGSNGTIEFEDGSQIQLGPDTMVKIVVEQSVGVGSLSRAPKIQVLQGNVEAKAVSPIVVVTANKEEIIEAGKTEVVEVKEPEPKVEEPPPPPEPAEETSVVILSPKQKAKFSPEKNSSGLWGVQIQPEWRTSPENFPAQAEIKNELGKIIFQSSKTGSNVFLSEPGVYSLSVKTTPEDPEKFLSSEAKSSFTIVNRAGEIRLLPPLISGEEKMNNQIQDEQIQDFSITFRWEATSPSTKYNVQFFSNPKDSKSFFQKEVLENQLFIEQKNVPYRRFYYQVSTETPEGFLLRSKKEMFQFQFLPPKLQSPESQSSRSLAEIKSGQGGLLFTWEKTNFTKNYVFQLSSQSNFSKVLISKELEDNFLIIKNPRPGTYFWRVRSKSKDKLISPFSSPYVVTISP